MVLVFRTSVTEQKEIEQLKPFLNQLTGGQLYWNFDLEDCDRILRIESGTLDGREVIQLLQEMDFDCEELEDIIVKLV